MNSLQNMQKTYIVLDTEYEILLFDYLSLTIVKIGEEHKQVLQLIDNNKYDKNTASIKIKKAYQDICDLAKRNIAFHSKEISCPLPDNYNFFHAEISFPTIHKCNLKCKYCFADAGEKFAKSHKEVIISEKIICKALEYMVYTLAPYANYYRIDFVSGGEPLLQYKTIQFVQRQAVQLSNKIGKPILIWACTNGTCFNDATIKMLNDTHLSIGISLDGPQKKHDSARIFKDGTGTYDTVLNTIDYLSKNMNTTRKIKDAWVLSVLHKENLNPLEILEHHISCGFNTIQMTPARLPNNHPLAIGNKEMDELISNYHKMKRKIIYEIFNNNISSLKIILNDRDCLGRIILLLIQKQKLIYRCGAGKYKIAVAANGDIYPCDSFVGDEQFIIGNLFSSEKKLNNKDFIQSHIFNRKPCSTCWNRYLCGGDCYYNSYVLTTKIMGVDEKRCTLKKELSVCAIEIVYALSKNTPIFRSIVKFINKRRIIYKGERDALCQHQT